jgi:integrase
LNFNLSKSAALRSRVKRASEPTKTLSSVSIMWVCAYSGARVNELTSLYPADVAPDEETEIWCMIIKPSLEKTAKWRTVPIHSHVVEQGFLDYVERRRRAQLPLFYDPSRSRGGKSGNPQFKKVAERVAGWVPGFRYGNGDREC